MGLVLFVYPLLVNTIYSSVDQVKLFIILRGPVITNVILRLNAKDRAGMLGRLVLAEESSVN